MKSIQNLHTHTTYCDGVNTPEEMIKAAIDKNFCGIGFSGHSYMFFSESQLIMTLEGTEEYKKEIISLKEKYKDQIDVFLGLELDAQSKVNLKDYDYIIGSVHYLKIGDKYVNIDRREANDVKNVIDTYFDKNGLAFAKKYYDTVSEFSDYGNIDIIGHFDLITKHLEKAQLFDTQSSEYLLAAKSVISLLKGKVPFFEINTGAISRGFRKTPYPQIELIKEFKRQGFGAVISSDCHDARFLDTAFSDAREILKECGYKEHYILTKDGFKGVML